MKIFQADKVKVTANEKKLKIVDESAAIQRHACKECGVHLYGRIEQVWFSSPMTNNHPDRIRCPRDELTHVLYGNRIIHSKASTSSTQS